MTDEVNPNREQNIKILKIVGGVLAAIILIGIISGGSSSPKQTSDTTYTPDTSYVAPTTVDNTAAWTTWKNGYLPVWNRFYANYQQTITDLNNSDVSAASQDFLAMSNNAVDMMAWSDSPDNTINVDVQTLAADIAALAAEGNQSLINITSGGSMTYGFQGAVDAVRSDIDTMTADLNNINSGYYY